MARKTDRRTIYTKNVIKDACYEALKKKPIEQITVTELCQAAEINRSTFYLHYPDARAVYEDMLCEVLDNIEPTGRKIFRDQGIDWISSNKIYKDIMKDERETFLLKIGMSYEPFITMFAEREVEWALPYFQKHSRLSDDDLRVILNSLFCSYLLSDRYFLKSHTVKELEHFNELMSNYIISPVCEKLITN